MSRTPRQATKNDGVETRRATNDSVVYPPEDVDEVVRFGAFLEKYEEVGYLVARDTGDDDQIIRIPSEIYTVIRRTVESMRERKAITIVSNDMQLTTQDAADFLGISRPTLVKLLESQKISYTRPNRHRRIRLTDLVEFQVRRSSERREVLDSITREAGELAIYDGTPDQYSGSIQRARRNRKNLSKS